MNRAAFNHWIYNSSKKLSCIAYYVKKKNCCHLDLYREIAVFLDLTVNTEHFLMVAHTVQNNLPGNSMIFYCVTVTKID